MTLLATPQIGRRHFLLGSLAGGGVLLMPPLLSGQQRVPTPAATPGPFYPPALPADIDNDLVLVRGSAAKAEGVVTHIRGRVLNLLGEPVAGAQVEIWQCDMRGRYLHPGSGNGPRDSAFQGFGRTLASADGSYSFRTIKPVPYAGRTPHIHFGVTHRRGALVTQMYVAGEPLNARDFVYARIADQRQRAAVTVALQPANGLEDGALVGEFDIVLG